MHLGEVNSNIKLIFHRFYYADILCLSTGEQSENTARTSLAALTISVAALIKSALHASPSPPAQSVTAFSTSSLPAPKSSASLPKSFRHADPAPPQSVIALLTYTAASPIFSTRSEISCEHLSLSLLAQSLVAARTSSPATARSSKVFLMSFMQSTLASVVEQSEVAWIMSETAAAIFLTDLVISKSH